MPRSHPPTLLKTLVRTVREECDLPKGGCVLVAVSGGGDSMALMDALAKSMRVLCIRLVAHGVDHGLRVGAAAELDQAEAFASTLEVPFTRSRLALPGGSNIQQRARVARYAALREAAAAAGAAVIATAHHADDRAETVLLRLLRGAGPRGLAVLPPRAGDLVRPLIRAPKDRIVAHLQRHRVPYAEDPSNRDPRFLRARVRHELLPLLQALSPGIIEHLNALADQLSHPEISRLTKDAALPTRLNRAQLEGIERASRLGRRGARIRLGEGKELVVDAITGDPVILG